MVRTDKFLLSPLAGDWTWSPPSHLFKGSRGLFAWDKTVEILGRSPHLCLMPILRMGGSLTQLPQVLLCRVQHQLYFIYLTAKFFHLFHATLKQ